MFITNAWLDEIMEYKILLKYNRGRNWQSFNNIHFKGYGFDADSNFLYGDNSVQYFYNFKLENGKEKLYHFNGIYSLIIQGDGEVTLISDKTRFYPLFYCRVKKVLYISDNIYELARITEKPALVPSALIELHSGGFVSGKKTIFKDIFQVQAGEIISFAKDGEVTSERFATFSTSEGNLLKKHSKKVLHNLAYQKFEIASANLAKAVKGRQVLLPLSGGYDSRLIACWLKQNQVDNVICFTYGRKGTKDIAVSQKVAKELGYEWHYIRYDEEQIKGFLKEADFKAYYRYMANGTAMFYMQEYFAVKWLFKNKVIQDGFIALPGHSGDFLGGSQLLKIIPPKENILIVLGRLINKTYNNALLSKEERKRVMEMVSSQLGNIKSRFNSDLDYSIMEDWLLHERIIKYVFNSSHVFNHFGGEVFFPFWDNALFDFWKTVPVEYRKHKKLYDDVLEARYFKPLRVNFKKVSNPTASELVLQNFKCKIRKHLPLGFRQRLRLKNDWPFYHEITAPFKEELLKNQIAVMDNGVSYLSRITQWYELKMKDEFGCY